MKLIVISSPEKISGEIRKIVALFKAGLTQFHVRKPEFTDFEMLNYITSIPEKFRRYLVLHSHYHLANEFNIKGIQVSIKRITEAAMYKADFEYYGYSAHSFDEIIANKDKYTHFFLSPVFDSISKKNYKANFGLSEISDFLIHNPELKVIALGGINPSNSKQCKDMGFSGVALLGTIWQTDDTLQAFNQIKESINHRNFTLSIAGFDPSSGAGINADIKTFEQHKVQGLTAITAITYQNENEFFGVDWLSFKQVAKQLKSIFTKHNPEFVKVGLIESVDVLQKLINLLQELNPSVKIIWDPILKASANFDFHQMINKVDLSYILKRIYLITPNIPECESLFGTSNTKDIQSLIVEQHLCKVLLKGGHSTGKEASDILVEQDGITAFKGKRLENRDKHGTGCVLSSAVCSNLAKGNHLQLSIKKAKAYVTRFIESNNQLLGYHHLSDH